MTEELKFTSHPEVWVERHLWDRPCEDDSLVRMSIFAESSKDMAKTLNALASEDVYLELVEFHPPDDDCTTWMTRIYCHPRVIEPALVEGPMEHGDSYVFIIDPRIFWEDTEAMRYVDEEVRARAELKSGASVN